MAISNSRLRAAREKKGWTQAEVAEKLETTNVNVSRWESGAIFPSRYYQEKLCTLYDASPQELGLIHGGVNEVERYPTPPFLFNEPLLEAGQLYGRQREKKTLLSRTTRKASTAVVGPRRIGKTWLLQHFLLSAPRQLSSNFRIGYLDVMAPSCKTVAGFAIEALHELGLTPPPGMIGLEALDRSLQELSTKQIAPVLCIDEFDSISGREEFSLAFFEGLRAMAVTKHLVLIISSKSPLRQVADKKSKGSPFFNIFEQVTLKPFDNTDTELFVFEKGNLARFQPDERRYLWTYGRMSENDATWWPIRLQLAGKILFEDLDLARRNPNYRQIFEEQFNTNWQAIM